MFLPYVPCMPMEFIIVEADVRAVIQFVCIYAVHPKSLVDPEEGVFLIFILYIYHSILKNRLTT